VKILWTKDIICVNNNQKYKKLYDDILKEPDIDFPKELNLSYHYADDIYRVETEKLFTKIIPNIQELWPDLFNFPDEFEGKCNYIFYFSDEFEEKCNNIIYYDEKIDNSTSISIDCDYFKRHTQISFIFCSNLESLNLVRADILNEIEKDERIIFNLITFGETCNKIM